MIKKITACALLVASVVSSTAFAATPAGHWFEGSVEKAAEFYPYVKSQGFGPDGNITYRHFANIATNVLGRAVAYSTEKADSFMTRYEALSIICERMGLEEKGMTSEEELSTALAIADFNYMPQEYKRTALLSVKNGLIGGDENGNVNMGDMATYAEILTVFIRINNK